MLDYHVILDLLPTTANLFFQRRLGDDVRLTAVQSSILLALGLQRKTVEDVEVYLFIAFPFVYTKLIVINRQSSSCLCRKFSRYSARSSEKSPIG